MLLITLHLRPATMHHLIRDKAESLIAEGEAARAQAEAVQALQHYHGKESLEKKIFRPSEEDWKKVCTLLKAFYCAWEVFRYVRKAFRCSGKDSCGSGLGGYKVIAFLFSLCRPRAQ